MSVDRDTVAQIAKLARIRIEEDQMESLAAELSNILGWIEQLNELDTEGVAPMTSVVEVEAPGPRLYAAVEASNIRSGPGRRYSRLGRLVAGERVQVDGSEGE